MVVRKTTKGFWDGKEADNFLYECKCDRCGRIFSSGRIIEFKYQEYAGATFQFSFVSPCCHSSYAEIDKYGNEF